MNARTQPRNGEGARLLENEIKKIKIDSYGDFSSEGPYNLEELFSVPGYILPACVCCDGTHLRVVNEVRLLRKTYCPASTMRDDLRTMWSSSVQDEPQLSTEDRVSSIMGSLRVRSTLMSIMERMRRNLLWRTIVLAFNEEVGATNLPISKIWPLLVHSKITTSEGSFAVEDIVLTDTTLGSMLTRCKFNLVYKALLDISTFISCPENNISNEQLKPKSPQHSTSESRPLSEGKYELLEPTHGISIMNELKSTVGTAVKLHISHIGSCHTLYSRIALQLPGVDRNLSSEYHPVEFDLLKEIYLKLTLHYHEPLTVEQIDKFWGTKGGLEFKSHISGNIAVDASIWATSSLVGPLMVLSRMMNERGATTVLWWDSLVCKVGSLIQDGKYSEVRQLAASIGDEDLMQIILQNQVCNSELRRLGTREIIIALTFNEVFPLINSSPGGYTDPDSTVKRYLHRYIKNLLNEESDEVPKVGTELHQWLNFVSNIEYSNMIAKQVRDDRKNYFTNKLGRGIGILLSYHVKRMPELAPLINAKQMEKMKDNRYGKFLAFVAGFIIASSGGRGGQCSLHELHARCEDRTFNDKIDHQYARATLYSWMLSFLPESRNGK